MIEVRPFTPADYLRSPEEIRDFLQVAAEDGALQHLEKAQAIAKRARRQLKDFRSEPFSSAAQSVPLVDNQSK